MSAKLIPGVNGCLLVGANLATAAAGRSHPLRAGAPSDREFFRSLRSQADLILVGGKTFITEPYRQSSVPLAIYATSDLLTIKSNPVARIVSGEIGDVISKLRESFGGEPKILCEGGPTLISALIQMDLVDQLFLSRSTLNGDSDFFDVDQTKKMLLVSSSDVLDHYRRQ
jgi:riboflavin biosynthesis pyrimidine reductase